MSHASATVLLVLHGLRLKGFAEASAVAALWDLDPHEIERELKQLAGDGLVQRRDGRVSGWALTATGRGEHERLVAEELEATATRDAIDGAYQRFLAVNPDLLGACTAWQLRPEDGGQVVNDHSDHEYDGGVVERLLVVHDRIEPVLADLAGALDRFGFYDARLGNAMERVVAGETEWFTRPVLDSYHTVWFELHEDLLSTLGLQRGAEGRG